MLNFGRAVLFGLRNGHRNRFGDRMSQSREGEVIARLYVFIFVVTAIAVLTLIARQFELLWPIDDNLPQSDVVSDWKVVTLNLILAQLAQPFAGACGAVVISAAGGGLIHLRTDGWWYLISLTGVVIVSDLYLYCLHRLQHGVPVLWALRSFHHSAEALTFVTGARHLWLDRAIATALLSVIPILVTIPGDLAAVIAIIFFLPNGCAQLNLRLRLGPPVTWLNNPQWHRIHHSVQPEHQHKNFVSLLPIWDILFGTAWIPRSDEYPAAGLVLGEKPGLIDSVVWPVRHYLRGLRIGIPNGGKS